MCRVLQLQDCAYALAQKPLKRSLSLSPHESLLARIRNRRDHPKRKWLEKRQVQLGCRLRNIKLCAYAQDLTLLLLRKSAHLVEALLRVSDIRLLLLLLLFGHLLLLVSLSLSAPHVGAFMLFRRLLLRSLPAPHVIGQKNSLRTLSIELLSFLEVLHYKCGSK